MRHYVSVEPKSSTAHMELGRVLRRIHRFREAQASFQEAQNLLKHAHGQQQMEHQKYKLELEWLSLQNKINDTGQQEDWWHESTLTRTPSWTPSWNSASKFPQWSMGNQKARMDVCVPALASDVPVHLPRLLASIEKQTMLPNSVIIVVSNLTTSCHNIHSYLRSTHQQRNAALPYPLWISCRTKLQHQSISRNECAELSINGLGMISKGGVMTNINENERFLSQYGKLGQGAELISFIDADDIMHKSRIATLTKVAESSEGGIPMILLHGLQLANGKSGTSPSEDDIIAPSLTRGEKLWDMVDGSKFIDNRLHVHPRIHHGHPTVYWAVFRDMRHGGLKFREGAAFYRKEDSYFVRDVIAFYGRHQQSAVWIDAPLVTYIPSHLSMI